MKTYTKEDLKAIRYKHLVVSGIRKKYSIDDEISILRQKETKPEEYAAWNEYVEQVKEEVRKIVYPEDINK